MKISYQWLKEYIDIKTDPEKLCEDLSNFGFTVESLVKYEDDYILDLEINPNRGDCLSIKGIARELSALYQLPLINQDIKFNDSQLNKTIDVSVINPSICPRYTARIIDNIKIQPSPDWMQKKLQSYGFRPINNIVDITNYVMVATGQPLHAFDWNKIGGQKMNIGTAKDGDKITTLDGKRYNLPNDSIVIRDGEDKIFDLAGIMGGETSEVDGQTKTIILQGAIFDPKLIRRSSKLLNLVTDASYRYERSVDYNGTIEGVNLATELINKLNNNIVVSDLIDKKFVETPDSVIELDTQKVNSFLGVKVTKEKMIENLTRLGFVIAKQSDILLNVIIPSYRQSDVKIWQDLAEEIARVYGYGEIVNNLNENKEPLLKNDEWEKRNTLSALLKNLGFYQNISFTFINEKQLTLVDTNSQDIVKINNPLSADNHFLQPSMKASLLQHIAKNPWAPDIAVFEIGKVFRGNEEKWQLGVATTKNNQILIDLFLSDINYEGEIETIDQKILDFYKIRRPIKCILIDVNKIKIDKNEKLPPLVTEEFREISKYPPSVRDLAFVVDDTVNAQDVIEEICNNFNNILFTELFDEYKSEKLGQNKKNLAFHLWFQKLNGPVEEMEIEKDVKNIIKLIEKKFGGKLRS